MSALIDQQRREDAEAERSHRLEAFLLELLAQVRARRQDLPMRVVAERVGRSERTTYRREQTLDEVLEVIDRKGIKQPGST